MIKSLKFIGFRAGLRVVPAHFLPVVMSDHLQIIRDFLHERLAVDPGRVVAPATLAELEVDSLMLLELFFEFEEKLDLTLSKDLPTPKTVGELLAIVDRLQAVSAAT